MQNAQEEKRVIAAYMVRRFYGEKFRLTIDGRCSGSGCWCVWCRKIALKAVFVLLCWNSRGGVGYWNMLKLPENYDELLLNEYFETAFTMW